MYQYTPNNDYSDLIEFEIFMKSESKSSKHYFNYNMLI